MQEHIVNMKRRFILFLRRSTFYVEDSRTKKQTSLFTKDRLTAERLLHAKNEAEHQPAVNLQIARAYLAASDPQISSRSWQFVMTETAKLKKGPTLERWTRAMKDPAFDGLRNLPVIETRPEHFLRVLELGKVSTNVFLRRLHNFALDMTWLPWPVIVKRQWPKPSFKSKRAITWEEHLAIVTNEKNPERRSFYQLMWFVGAAQSDLAFLEGENIDLQNRTISFSRKKTGSIVVLRFGEEVKGILRNVPSSGPLFPYLRTVRASDRATEFKQRCGRLGIKGITLHSYRYAWAERAKQCGYPERFAQEALGHNSKAVHRAYARNAKMELPSLEEFSSAQQRMRAENASESA